MEGNCLSKADRSDILSISLRSQRKNVVDNKRGEKSILKRGVIMEVNNLIKFRQKFRLLDLTIFETEYWVWSLRPEQATLGSGVLSLKRECARFSDLLLEEYMDLDNVIKAIENTLHDAFEYDVINYLMLMMVDKQLHFHVFPRYASELWLFGRQWIDKGWPGQPDLNGFPLGVNLLEIRDYIRTRLVA